MTLRDITIKYTASIALGFIAFYLDELEVVNPVLNTAFIIIISLSKTGFFVQQSLRKIAEVVNKNVAYLRFVIL